MLNSDFLNLVPEDADELKLTLDEFRGQDRWSVSVIGPDTGETVLNTYTDEMLALRVRDELRVAMGYRESFGEWPKGESVRLNYERLSHDPTYNR